MEYVIKYKDLDKTPLIYKDAFMVYLQIIKDRISAEGLPADKIVTLMNNDLINVNRAPLIVLKRVSSVQPPAVNNVNERVTNVGNQRIISGASLQSISLAIMNYGNSYLEAEKLGSLVQEAIIVTSVNKIREVSKGMIVGHEYLGWSGTDYVNQNSKLLINRIDIKLTVAFEYAVRN